MEGKFSRRNLLKAGLGVAALGAVSAPQKSFGAPKFKWRMQTHWPTGVGYYKPLYEGFCNLVKQATAGQVEITPLPSGAIVPTKDVFEAVGRGLFEIAWSFPAYHIGKVPVAGHFNGMPFGWENFEETFVYLDRMGGRDIIQKAYAEQGLYSLPGQPVSGVTVYSKKPIKTIDDFKGLKIRSTGVVAEVFKKAGATPVFFPGEELYQALQTGVCDAAHWGSVSAGWDMRFQEVTKFIIRPYFGNITNCEIFVNLNTWNKLSADLKAIIEQAAYTNAVNSISWFLHNDYVRMKEFEEKKMGQISWMSEETIKTLRKFSLEVVDEYSKKDPKYCAPAGNLLKDLLKSAGRI